MSAVLAVLLVTVTAALVVALTAVYNRNCRHRPSLPANSQLQKLLPMTDELIQQAPTQGGGGGGSSRRFERTRLLDKSTSRALPLQFLCHVMVHAMVFLMLSNLPKLSLSPSLHTFIGDGDSSIHPNLMSGSDFKNVLESMSKHYFL